MNEMNYSAKATVNHIRDWETEDRKCCWSGTPYGVITALGENLDCDVIDYDAKLNKVYGFIFRKATGLLRKFKINDFGLLNAVLHQIEISEFMKRNDNPSIVYTAYNCSKGLNRFYIYLDLSVNWCADYVIKNKADMSYTPIGEIRHQGLTLAIIRQYEKKFYSRCAGIFTMSRFLADYITEELKIPSDKVHVVGAGCNVPAGVNENRFVSKNGKRFLFVGKDWERKNGPLVVSAFRLLQAKYSDVELYIIGPEQFPENYKTSENIIFLSRLPYEEIAGYYRLCDFFVMPSHFEAFGIVFTEALINGLPCIGRNAFAMPEIITDGSDGLLLDEEQPEKLFSLMEKLYLNQETFKNNVAMNRERYKSQYSWNTVTDKMLKTIRQDKCRSRL